MNKSKLKEVRESKNLTQQQLAEKSGVSVQMIRVVEQGRGSLEVVKANKLAKALRVSKNGLFD